MWIAATMNLDPNLYGVAGVVERSNKQETGGRRQEAGMV